MDILGCVFTENRDPALFSMVTWALWTRQNNLRLGKPTVTLDQLLHQAKDRLREFNLHNTTVIPPVGRPPTHWLPPEASQYKINFDGALFQTANSTGIGVIIRDERGQVMVTLSQKIPPPFTAIEVEALAARRALELAMETSLD